MRLRNALVRKNPSFVVLYGRRRLGKSTLLVRKVLGESDVWRYACQGTLHVWQLHEECGALVFH